MKKSIIILGIVLCTIQGMFAQEDTERNLFGLSGVYPSYNFETGKWGGGLEVIGVGHLGIGAQVDFFPRDSSLTFAATRMLFLIPITEQFLIKLAGGVQIDESRKNIYSDNLPTIGIGSVYALNGFYLGLQANLKYNEELRASSLSLIIGLKFN